MAGYARVDGHWHCERVPLAALARACGTPAYVYSAGCIRERVARLEAALAGVPHRIHYACKANASLGLLALLESLGAGIDVVSGGELHRSLAAGVPAGRIIYGGVGKSSRELREALAAGVDLISVESAAELRLVARLAEEAGRVARVGIRVNPEVAVDALHDYVKTGQKGDKFGVPFDEALEVARLAAGAPSLRLVSVGMHVGSQLRDFGAIAAGLERLAGLVAAVRAAGVDTLEHLDIGGGLFVPYGGEEPVDLAAYAALVGPCARRLGLSLIVEPGRYLVAEAGVLLTEVLYRKRSGGRDILVTDAGMSELMRPALYQAHHHIDAVAPVEGRGRFDVVGPICESGDFLALDRELPAVKAGALLCVFTTGAYGASMASTYNARPRAPEVLVDGARWAVITARETYAELVQRESATPDWRTS